MPDMISQLMKTAEAPEVSQEALSALDPKQQLGVMQSLEQQRQGTRQALSAAGQLEQSQQELEQAQEQFQKKFEEQQLQNQINETLEKRKLDLQEKRNEAYKDWKAQQTRKAELEADKIDKSLKLLDNVQKRTVTTNAGEMPLSKYMARKNLGQDIEITQREVLDHFIGPEGQIKLMVTNPGGTGEDAFDFIAPQELEGFKSPPDTKIGGGVFQETMKREKAQIEAAISSPEWGGKILENWRKNKPALHGDLQSGNATEKARAERDLVGFMKDEMRTSLGGEEVVVRSDGFYTEDGEFLRDLPGVNPENVVTTDEEIDPQPENQTQKQDQNQQGDTQYNSPEDVKSAVTNGNISKEQGVKILRDNWPNQFE